MAEHRIPNPSVVGSSPTGPVLESKSALTMENKESQLGRWTIFILSVLLAVYVGYGLYINVTKPITGSVTIGMVLGVVVGLALIGVGYFYTMVNVATVARIDETEGELRKVIWPKSMPIAASTELWQYTIAVVVMMFVLVLYIAVVDSAISFVLDKILYMK